MFKLLIADDEYLSRHAFSVILKKNFPEISIVGEAENGIEILEKARAVLPDIIVMDIRMPGINGLAAAEQILSEMPSVVIIIISAYEEFDYLQKALELGVKAYILKPFHTNSIVTKLKRIINCIKTEREAKVHPHVEFRLNVIEKTVQKELVRTYINNGVLTKSTAFYMDFFHYDIQQGYFLLVIFHNLTDSIREDASHYTFFREKISLSISESVEYLCFHMVGNFILNYLPVFIPVQANDSFQTDSMLIGKEILRKLNYHHLPASISIGTVKTGVESFYLSYQEALSGLNKLAPGEIKIMKPSSKSTPRFSYPHDMEDILIQELKKKNLSQAGNISRKMISEIITAPEDLSLKKEYIAQHFAAMKHTLHSLGFDMNDFNHQWPFSSLSYMENEEELLTFCTIYLDNLIAILSRQNQSSNFALTKKVETYLSEYLTDASHLSLENMASYLGLSPQYVSKIFKEEYSQTFTEYIAWRRVELAKSHLRQTDFTVSQIAKMVGYTDSNYFCRIFKKLTGMTPKEYRLNN